MQCCRYWHFNMASTQKKTALTIKEKYLDRKDLQKGLTKNSVAEKFSVPQNALTYWIKQKEDIISKYESGQFDFLSEKFDFFGQTRVFKKL